MRQSPVQSFDKTKMVAIEFDPLPLSLATSGIASPPLDRAQTESLTASVSPRAVSPTGRGWNIVPLVNKLQTTMKLAQLPCLMIEERLFNREIFGRENNLKQLDEVLISGSDTANRSTTGYARPNQLTLCGQEGLGKSEIAIHSAFTRHKHFDAIFWVRADDPGKLEAGCKAIFSCYATTISPCSITY